MCWGPSLCKQAPKIINCRIGIHYKNELRLLASYRMTSNILALVARRLKPSQRRGGNLLSFCIGSQPQRPPLSLTTTPFPSFPGKWSGGRQLAPLQEQESSRNKLFHPFHLPRIHSTRRCSLFDARE
ncbi:hypothetical protein TNCT_432771 [Trichonephila clavata]|uniref:Uncharacterized protein n=1 Tax=Trichonephila clavata TaxID=2740835 RepID=A0A8X6M5V4_TRICU|nr:hypothetical protein TNCT_432771 [Trichonephila clavata]